MKALHLFIDMVQQSQQYFTRKKKLNFCFRKYFPFYFFLSLDLPISTRFYALSLARHVCPQIRVFGMELENPCERFVKYLIICKTYSVKNHVKNFLAQMGFTQSEVRTRFLKCEKNCSCSQNPYLRRTIKRFCQKHNLKDWPQLFKLEQSYPPDKLDIVIVDSVIHVLKKLVAASFYDFAPVTLPSYILLLDCDPYPCSTGIENPGRVNA